MSASTKVLIVLTAIAAFGVGWVVNSAQLEAEIDVRSMLSAKLLVSSPAEPNGTPTDNTTATVQERLGELTLVNFWASWCTPCREEMPMFEALYRQHQAAGFKVVGITIDSPANAQPMLDSMDISYPILYAEQTGMDIMAGAGNPNGFLPYSLLLDSAGKVIEQKVGTIEAADIEQWLQLYL